MITEILNSKVTRRNISSMNSYGISYLKRFEITRRHLRLKIHVHCLH